MPLQFLSPLPESVDVLIIGGGIHGAGVLHDLATRGTLRIHLLEKNQVGSGTSSRSTKLIHGGLRYLKQPAQIPLVAESLRERRLLLNLLPEIVKPIEILVPVERLHESVITRLGLGLYDFLSRGDHLASHRSLDHAEAKKKAPYIDTKKFSHILSYWDAQTDDFELVRTVARSAVKLGVALTEECHVTHLKSASQGWNVTATHAGKTHMIQARYVINCAGPWAHHIISDDTEPVKVQGINNKGSHFLLKNFPLTSGLLLRAPSDGRYFFALPWNGLTLVGTTEEAFDADPDSVRAEEREIDYLLHSLNAYCTQPVKIQDIVGSFAGLRWLVAQGKDNLSAFSRESLLAEQGSPQARLLTVYGGKLTSYRKLSERIADKVMSHFGLDAASRTAEASAWVRPEITQDTKALLERFVSSRAAHLPFGDFS
jgi:glycerol-3-phosphate dehydrogenase